MDAIVLRALVKDPDYRYQSADEMRADIEACLDGQPVAATAAMGAVGYGYGSNDQATAALRQADPAGQTSMLPPMNPDDGGFNDYDDRPDRRRQKKSNTSTILLVLAGILVLVGAVLIGRSVFGDNGGGAGDIPVPTIVGKKVAEAKTLATNAGVTITQSGTERCDQPKGSICSQDPASGNMQQGETIQYVLSEGAPQIEVPDVTEKSEANAKEALDRKGFEVKVTKQESDEEPGTVLKQDPKGGSQAEEGATVTITVAEQSLVDVPPVVGQPFDNAQAQLTALGFKVVRNDVDSDQPLNTVTEQSPTGKAAKGETITLKVSKGPQQQQTQVPQLFGQTLDQARQLLAQAGLQLGSVDGPNDGNARILVQDPAAGTPVAPNQQVNVKTTRGDGNNGGGNNGAGGLFGGGDGD